MIILKLYTKSMNFEIPSFIILKKSKILNLNKYFQRKIMEVDMFSELSCNDPLTCVTLKLKLLEETMSYIAIYKYLMVSDFI